jgi:hypothetical protein
MSIPGSAERTLGRCLSAQVPQKLGARQRSLVVTRISADGLVSWDLPANEHGPEGVQGALRRRALDDRLDLRACDPEPEQANDGLHDHNDCGDGRN